MPARCARAPPGRGPGSRSVCYRRQLTITSIAPTRRGRYPGRPVPEVRLPRGRTRRTFQPDYFGYRRWQCELATTITRPISEESQTVVFDALLSCECGERAALAGETMVDSSNDQGSPCCSTGPLTPQSASDDHRRDRTGRRSLGCVDARARRSGVPTSAGDNSLDHLTRRINWRHRFNTSSPRRCCTDVAADNRAARRRAAARGRSAGRSSAGRRSACPGRAGDDRSPCRTRGAGAHRARSAAGGERRTSARALRRFVMTTSRDGALAAEPQDGGRQ